MRFQIGLSRRAYAERRGVSDKAVRKAIGTGRIAAAVLPDGTIDADLADTLWEANTDATQRRGREAERAETSMRERTAMVAQPAPVPPSEPVAAPEQDEDEPEAPAPRPLRPADFEEDPPRRRPPVDVHDALAAHAAANRDRATGGARPGDPGAPQAGGTQLDLAAEEKREKIRKLRLANDEKERGLVAFDPVKAHVFALFLAQADAWQNWPGTVGPVLAAKWGVDPHGFTQDLKEFVRDHLGKLSATEEDMIRARKVVSSNEDSPSA